MSLTSQSFSVLCHRYAAQKPWLPWAEVCRQVSAQLRPKKAPVRKTQEIRLPYAD